MNEKCLDTWEFLILVHSFQGVYMCVCVCFRDDKPSSSPSHISQGLALPSPTPSSSQEASVYGPDSATGQPQPPQCRGEGCRAGKIV